MNYFKRRNTSSSNNDEPGHQLHDSLDSTSNHQWLNALKNSDVSQLLSMLKEFSSENIFSSPLKVYAQQDDMNEEFLGQKQAFHNYSATVSVSGENIDCLDVAINANNVDLLDLFINIKQNDPRSSEFKLDEVLWKACFATHITCKVVIRLLELGADPLFIKNGISPFILAARNGKYDSLCKFLERDEDAVLVKHELNHTIHFGKKKIQGNSRAIHHACASGNHECIELLILKGSDLTHLDCKHSDIFSYAKSESVCGTILSAALKKYKNPSYLLKLPLIGIVKKGYSQTFKDILRHTIEHTSDSISMDVSYLQSGHDGHSEESLLELISNQSSVESFVDFLPVKALVNEFMLRYGYFILSIKSLYFFSFLVALTFSLILAADTANPNHYNTSSLQIWRGLCDGYALIVAILNGIFEIIEFLIIWRQKILFLYNRLKQKRTHPGLLRILVTIPRSIFSAFHEYATDWYNLFDSCAAISLIIYLPLRFTNTDSQWIFGSLIYFFNTMLIVKILTISPVATYVQIIFTTLFTDLPKFIIAFSFPLIAFAGSFYIALRYHGPRPFNRSDITVTASDEALREILLINSSYFNTLISDIRILIEQGSVVKTVYLLDLNWLAATYFFFFLFFTLLVFRALFIAQLSNTFARSRANGEIISTKFKLDYLTKLMGKGSAISLIIDVKKRFYTPTVKLTKSQLHNTFETEYQYYYGQDAARSKMLTETIVSKLTLIIEKEFQKQRQIIVPSND